MPTSSRGGKAPPFWKRAPFPLPEPLPYPPKTFIRVDGGTGGTGSRPSTGRLPASQQKASPEPLWFGAFLSLATAYGCFISTLEWRYSLFLQVPVGRSYLETFHPLSLETCNGSIIVKARYSFMQFKISADEQFLPRKSSVITLKNVMKATALKLRQSNAMTEPLQ